MLRVLRTYGFWAVLLIVLASCNTTKLGWTYKTELEDGIRLAYKDFLENPMRAER